MLLDFKYFGNSPEFRILRRHIAKADNKGIRYIIILINLSFLPPKIVKGSFKRPANRLLLRI